MNRLLLTAFSITRPKLILLLTAVLTLAAAWQFPKVHFDNDPENMLSADEPVRVLHNQIKTQFRLYDFVMVGVVNEAHPDGVFNVETLGRVDSLVRALMSLRRDEHGKPIVSLPAEGGQSTEDYYPSLQPSNAWSRLLAFAFRQDPERLFDEQGRSAIINREIISPGTVDNLRQAEQGQLALEYLLEQPPATRAEAMQIREHALSNPLYRNTMISADGQALGLYIPIQNKTYSYNVAQLIRKLTEKWPLEDQVFITGQPVAQDTFGVEMLVQMATSAPLAGLVIFLLLLVFFRRFSMVVAPMAVAGVSVIVTMGLLIGLGFEVHIMSSMIAIFLMPIAVADSVHLLSEFYDGYHRFKDKAATLRHVAHHLFLPMFYTSLTTMAGFASLALTPIPPVRIFGMHVAFGVGLAWLLTMTLVPAYLMLFVSSETLASLSKKRQRKAAGGFTLSSLTGRLGHIAQGNRRLIIILALVLVVGALLGISRIRVNDNPIKWFHPEHSIRVADRTLNKHFGGTYTAYLHLKASDKNNKLPSFDKALWSTLAEQSFAQTEPGLVTLLQGQITAAEHEDQLEQVLAVVDQERRAGWQEIADVILYLEPAGLALSKITSAISASDVSEEVRILAAQTLAPLEPQKGAALQDQALNLIDTQMPPSLLQWFQHTRVAMEAPLFKQPSMLRYVKTLQRHLENHPLVGKTSSAVDALRKAHYELRFYPAGANETTTQAEQRNLANLSVPADVEAVGQVFTQLEGMKKKDNLFHLVTTDYEEINLWIQLKSGDNVDMLAVKESVEDFIRNQTPPSPLIQNWAGLTYLNVVWQDRMVVGMLSALASSFAVVLIMMMVLFRSPLYGLLSMIPLSLTILLIYGIIGWVGKDYDMPVAVLSALTLGLSVDFAIHFLQRSRELQRKCGSWRQALGAVFDEPAVAISRNAVIISVGFTPLLFAPLVPYKTVGFFLATIMAVSWVTTLLLLAALVTSLQRWLFGSVEPSS